MRKVATRSALGATALVAFWCKLVQSVALLARGGRHHFRHHCGHLGRAANWRRVSETWIDPDLGDPELAFEIAARLTDYISAIEPARRA